MFSPLQTTRATVRLVHLGLLLAGDGADFALRVRRTGMAAQAACTQRWCRRILRALGVVVDAHATPQAREHVRDPLGHLQGACHVFGHAWAIVRPDGYLSATGEAVDAQLVKSIEHALGVA